MSGSIDSSLSQLQTLKDNCMSKQFQAAFDDWWKVAQSMISHSIPKAQKLRKTFFDILSKLPRHDLETFFAESPRIICNVNHGNSSRQNLVVPRKIPKDQVCQLCCAVEAVSSPPEG
jgi:hypothetical protein